MKSLLKYLKESLVFLDVDVSNTSELFDYLCNQLVEVQHIDKDTSVRFREALVKREELASTALEQGVAIPHAYVEGFPEDCTIFCRAKEAIEFGEKDGNGVRLFFFLCGPQKNIQLHLQMLAKLARLLRDEVAVNDLKTAVSPEELLNALKQVEQRHC